MSDLSCWAGIDEYTQKYFTSVAHIYFIWRFIQKFDLFPYEFQWISSEWKSDITECH